MEKTYKNDNVGNFDQYQMDNRAFDPMKDAYRFTLVDGLDIKADTINIPEIKLPQQSPVVIKEIEYKEIQVPQIIVETKIEQIQVPVIVREIELVDRPVIVPEIRIIEKPVIIREIEYKVIELKVQEMPNIAKICMVVQTLALFGLLIMSILRKGI